MAGMLFCPSDSASSCFIMSAFSDLFTFFGPLVRVFITITNTARAVTTPMQTMLVIDACFLGECGGKLQKDCPFLGLGDVGYRCCCPQPALVWFSAWLESLSVQ